MTKQEKLLSKLISRPGDFTYNELIRLLRGLGYEEISHKIKLHKPHPGNFLKRYQIDLIIQELKSKNLL